MSQYRHKIGCLCITLTITLKKYKTTVHFRNILRFSSTSFFVFKTRVQIKKIKYNIEINKIHMKIISEIVRPDHDCFIWVCWNMNFWLTWHKDLTTIKMFCFIFIVQSIVRFVLKAGRVRSLLKKTLTLDKIIYVFFFACAFGPRILNLLQQMKVFSINAFMRNYLSIIYAYIITVILLSQISRTEQWRRIWRTRELFDAFYTHLIIDWTLNMIVFRFLSAIYVTASSMVNQSHEFFWNHVEVNVIQLDFSLKTSYSIYLRIHLIILLKFL